MLINLISNATVKTDFNKNRLIGAQASLLAMSVRFGRSQAFDYSNL